MPVVLLVVHGEVLDRCDHALRLHAVDIGNHQRRIQERIFGEVFEVAARQGRAGDVHAGAEQKVDAARAGIPAQTLADSARQLDIPTGGQRNAGGIGGRRSPGAHSHRTVGHLQARQADCRNGMREHPVDAAQQHNLLFQSELGQHGMGLGLDCG